VAPPKLFYKGVKQEIKPKNYTEILENKNLVCSLEHQRTPVIISGNVCYPLDVALLTEHLPAYYKLENWMMLFADIGEVHTSASRESLEYTDQTISTIKKIVEDFYNNIINEVNAIGGRDEENDESLRKRIKEGPNQFSRDTLKMLEQVFMSYNNKVLSVFHQGTDRNGRILLGLTTVNGVNLNDSELNNLLAFSAKYLTLSEYKPFGSEYEGVLLKNVEVQPLDISFRVDLNPGVDPDQVRRDIQVVISKYLDPTKFDSSKEKVEWDNLLQIVKSTKGVKYVPDQYFYPRIDIPVDTLKVVRLRGFLMLDLQGGVISNFSGTLSPVYYQNVSDFSYQQTVLRSI